MVNDTAVDSQSTKLGRFRNRLERGIRQPSMEHLRRPSMLFRNSHRRQPSEENVALDIQRLHLTPVRSRSHSLSSATNSINISPDMDKVSNFSSPARSIGSMDSLRLHRSNEMITSPSNRQHQSPSRSPSKGVTFMTPIPRISITPDEGSTHSSSSSSNEPSKLSRIKNKVSLFFEPELQTEHSGTSPARPRSLSTDDKGHAQRPQLTKAHSDTKQPTVESAEASTMKNEKELMRKRSRTLGSVEGDMYHRRSGSIVKTIGNIMLKRPADTPTSTGSISDTSEGAVGVPEREEGEAAESYVQRLVDEGFDEEMTTILSTDDSEFSKECLRLYLRQTFEFADDPLDIALRRLLMTCELPKEAQQIDRVLEAFSERYYSCNTDYWDNKDQVYFLAFSLVMLHTDHFNTHNKRKMTREEFVKNTRVEDPELKINNSFLSRELFEYFYDNITQAKFVQKIQLHQPQPQPLYLLPKRIFSSSSSTNLEGMGTMRQYPSNRSQSISSTTSQFFTVNIADPYFFMMTDQLHQLRLGLDPAKLQSPFEGRMQNSFPETYFQRIREAVTNKNGTFLGFNKSCNWLQGRTETVSMDEDADDSEKCLVRVIKCAELFKEETVQNKFFTIGNTPKVVWKRCYGMLTMCGFFIFESLSFMTFAEREALLKDEQRDEPLIIDVLSESMLHSCKKLSINGLFACQNTSEETHHTFNIFSTNKKELFSTPTVSAMSLWIIAINYVAALDSCYMDYPRHFNHEVVPMRTISLDDKVNKLISNLPTSRKKIDEVVRLERHLCVVAPLTTKTKDMLMQYHNSLRIRLDWLWYEVERNMAYLNILRNELMQENDDRYSMKEDDSILEDSFINQDTTESAERTKSHLNIVTNSADVEEGEGEEQDTEQSCVLVNGDCSTEDVENHETYEIPRRELEDLLEANTMSEEPSMAMSDGESDDDDDLFVDAETHEL